ncbi:MAG: multiheme c-type cytochrome [Pseudomonadota bacterium]
MPMRHSSQGSRPRRRGLLVILAFALAAAGLTARADEDSHISDSRYVGAASCGRCHPKAYQAWQRSAHARALEALDTRERQDPKCRQCHTMVPEESNPELGGVQCETCHGQGRYYNPEHVMRDRELRDALGFEAAGPETCTRCHTDNAPSVTPFVYEHKIARIRHDEK